MSDSHKYDDIIYLPHPVSKSIRRCRYQTDDYAHQIVFEDGTVLPVENLFSVEGELFRKLEDSYL